MASVEMNQTDANREIEKLRETLRAIRAINDRIIAGIGTSMPATVAALKTANILIDEAIGRKTRDGKRQLCPDDTAPIGGRDYRAYTTRSFTQQSMGEAQGENLGALHSRYGGLPCGNFRFRRSVEPAFHPIELSCNGRRADLFHSGWW